MAYQKIGTPRFYVDHIQYLKSINFNFEKFYEDISFTTSSDKLVVGDTPSIFNLNPENQISATHPFQQNDPTAIVDYFYWELPIFPTTENSNAYVAFLNHNLGDENARFLLEFYRYSEDKGGTGTTKNIILNLGTDLHGHHAQNGCTIINIPESGYDDDNTINFEIFRAGLGHIDSSGEAGHINIGALSYGLFYDMPVNPDLNLSMSIEYDGFTNIKTLSGHTITQANYQGSPWWYDINGNKVEPWSVGQSTGTSKRNGRRVWKLKFSYMSDKDLFASNYGSSTYAEDLNPYEPGDQDIPNLGANLLSDGDFESEFMLALKNVNI